MQQIIGSLVFLCIKAWLNTGLFEPFFDVMDKHSCVLLSKIIFFVWVLFNLCMYVLFKMILRLLVDYFKVSPFFKILFLPLRDSEGRKLCKKVKVDPSSKRGGAELLHYKWVTRNFLECNVVLHVVHRLLLAFWPLFLMCLAEMGHFTQSTTGRLPLRWVSPI